MVFQQMEPIYQFRCPIHGTIQCNEQERQIIDHPFFQRLRHISQLGFASYVYPGATHTRFSHSLGVMHLAGRIYDHIVQKEQSWLKVTFTTEDLIYFRHILRMAALLHDIGHTPFSHAAEAILPCKSALNLPIAWYDAIDLQQQATHEDFSIAIVFAMSQAAPALLRSNEAQDICSLIDHTIHMSDSLRQRCQIQQGPNRNIHPLLKNLISGEVDADRMDYLHRDSHYAGVNYGKYDLDRLIQGLSCVQTEHGIILSLERSALYAYENFLLARLHMFLQVYFHRTILPFDYYLKQALQSKEIELVITGDLQNFLMARDDSVLSELWRASHKKWASRIVFRKPPKRLFQFEHYHSHDLQEVMLQALTRAGVDFLFLQSRSYLSMLSSGTKKGLPLLVKNKWLNTTVYLPIQQISLLLEQYQQNANIRHLYCEPHDYTKACEILSPFMNHYQSAVS